MEFRAKLAFLLAMAMALGLIVYTLIGPGGASKRRHLTRELEQLRQENRKLAEENRRMALEVEALKKRQDYMEKVAREELGLVKPDEVVIHLSRSGDAKQVERRKTEKKDPDNMDDPGHGARPTQSP